MSEKSKIETQIMNLVREYYDVVHSQREFIPGKTKVPYSGRVFDSKEMVEGVQSVLDYWLTAGPYSRRFEETMRVFFDSKRSLLVNSGSSANLLMVATLCSNQVRNRLMPGDEVITPAVTFPTTLTPIVQNGLVPVFVDCKIGEYDLDTKQLESAVSEKTRAIFLPHTVGIPCDMDTVLSVAEKYGLWLLEDGCDALGGTWDNRLVGTFGAMSSISFYPAHHMTMGEGGMVIVNDRRLAKTALSIRDWGRDCWCEPGVSNTCGKRFGWELGDLPAGYDHKYIYSNLGYNLKVTDIQAALGCAQFEKLPKFIELRRRNANYLLEGLQDLQDKLILPDIPPKANPSWFGFPISVREGIDRSSLVHFLEDSLIETRLVFGGNILKQPGFQGVNHRVHGNLVGTDTIMERTFFIGVYPGLTSDMLEFVVSKFHEYFRN